MPTSARAVGDLRDDVGIVPYDADLKECVTT